MSSTVSQTSGDCATLMVAAGVAQFQLTLCPTCGTSDDIFWRLHNVVEWVMDLQCSKCNMHWSLCTLCSNVKKHIRNRDHLLRHCRCHHPDSLEKLKEKPSQSCSQKRHCGVEHNNPDMLEMSSNCGLSVHDGLDNVDMEPVSCVGSRIDDNNHFASFVATDVGEIENKSDFGSYVSSLLKGTPNYGVPKFNFDNKNSSRYFSHDLNDCRGKSMLVGWSQMKVEMDGDGKQYKQMEVDYHMKVASFVSKLTFKQIHQLAEIIDESCKITKQRTIEAEKRVFDSQYLQTTLPTTVQRIRRLYMDRQHGIVRCVPRPMVNVISGHGYVSIRECVADLLGHGVEMDFISLKKCENAASAGITRMSESRHALRILSSAKRVYGDMNALVLYFNEWSDDFEPLYSSKGNRGSTWVKTITIAPPPNKVHSLLYTYPIAVGRKSASHEVIENKFAEEMLELRSGIGNMFYSKAAGTEIPVFIDLFASLQDQPERRSANYIMLGGSKYAARWGHAADFAAVASGIPGCETCVKSLFMVGIDSSNNLAGSCPHCVNWIIDVSSGLLDFTPPKNFPMSEVTLPNKKLRPITITYELMQAAVVKAHENVSSGSWTSENATAYLWVNGLNKEARTEILTRATNLRTYNRLLNQQPLQEEEEFNALQRLKNQDPFSFKCWKFPAMWSRGTMLSQHVDVIMHLLFLGVIKTTIKHVEGWIKKRGKFDAFVKYVRGRLESVQSLKLGWCKALPYTGNKFGGWVSENYLALGRLLPWFYSTLPLLTGNPSPYVEPPGPYTKWTVKQLQYWLSNRGLRTKGLKAELQAKVHQYQFQEGGPPPVVGPPGGTAADVSDVVETMWCMASNAMAKSVDDNHVLLLDKQIRCFLNKFDSLDKKIRMSTKEAKPKWISSYNFICLLNLPDIVKQFGPLPNLWEGGGQGEKILSKLKPLHCGYRVGWQKNLLINVLDDMAMERVTSSLSLSGNCNWNDKSTDYSLYKSAAEVRIAFRRQRPMSVVQVKGDTDNFWALLTGTQEMVLIAVGDVLAIDVGLPYFNLEIASLSELTPTRRGLDAEIKHYCMLLPWKQQDLAVNNAEGVVGGSISGSYAIINSNWSCYFGGNDGFKKPIAQSRLESA